MIKRLENLRNLIKEKSLDGALIYMPENRFYFSGFTGSTGYLVITPKNNFFIADFRYIEQAKKQCEGYEVLTMSKDFPLSHHLKELNITNLGIEDNHMDVFTYKKLLSDIDNLEMVSIGEDLVKIRAIKDESEIENLRKAAEIADKAFEHILPFIKPGAIELDIAHEIESFMKKNGASGLSFQMIVASGKRSALPHGVASDKVLEDGDFLTLDFGCIYNGYCSDMTRTVVLGKATNEQKKIYNIVLEAQTKALSHIKPGVKGKDVDFIARDIISSYGYGDKFGHGLGHGVGLKVHELPNLNPEGDIILEPNMVVTDEPGIYIPDFGGVRIEDLVVVTENGHEILSKSPKELIEL